LGKVPELNPRLYDSLCRDFSFVLLLQAGWLTMGLGPGTWGMQYDYDGMISGMRDEGVWATERCVFWDWIYTGFSGWGQEFWIGNQGVGRSGVVVCGVWDTELKLFAMCIWISAPVSSASLRKSWTATEGGVLSSLKSRALRPCVLCFLRACGLVGGRNALVCDRDCSVTQPLLGKTRGGTGHMCACGACTYGTRTYTVYMLIR